VVKLGGSGSFRVSGGVMGRLGFRVGLVPAIAISAVSVILISCTRPPCPYRFAFFTINILFDWIDTCIFIIYIDPSLRVLKVKVTDVM